MKPLHSSNNININALSTSSNDMAEIYKQILQQCIHDKDLSAFYPPTDPRLDSAASRAAAHIENICTRWEIPLQDGRVLAKLALFDILLYIDNSGSMRMHPRDHRIEDLRYVVKMVVDVVKVLDGDGFDVRFMNGMRIFSPTHRISES